MKGKFNKKRTPKKKEEWLVMTGPSYYFTMDVCVYSLFVIRTNLEVFEKRVFTFFQNLQNCMLEANRKKWLFHPAPIV